MELLLGAIITLATQTFKWLVDKFGYKRAEIMTLFALFFLSIVGTLAYEYNTNGIDLHDIDNVFSVIGLAVGWYELVLKRVIVPVLNKFKK